MRDPAIDALRTVITLLVVLHHSVLAYIHFGSFNQRHYLWSTAPIVDGRRWAGFDVWVAFNDGWFMAAMFAIAGLFVLPGLRRYGPLRYMGRRIVRLGLPFAMAALVLMPLAYYPSFELTGAAVSYWQFWFGTVREGPWSAGPAWFLWVLLACDAGAVVWVTWLGTPAVTGSPRRRLIAAASVAMLGTVASLFAFGPVHWFSAGPFAVQASRVVLYATSFALGLCIGPTLADCRVKPQPVPCGLLFAMLVGLDLTSSRVPHGLWCVLYGVVSVGFCIATGLSALALARRCPQWWLTPLQRLGPDAFWIYVLHYVPLVWLQYALLEADLPAAVKVAIVFPLTLGASWLTAACIRWSVARLRPHRIPSTSVMS